MLKSFRLTLDYPNRTSYWLRQAPIDTQDLNQVGLVLARANDTTVIAGIAKKNSADTVTGVMPGDKLVKIDALETASATRGAVLAALHGAPGDRRHLVLERDGKRVEVDAVVTAF